MPTLLEILKDPDYINANQATKRAIFNKYSANEQDYVNANAATQAAIQQKFGLIAPAQPKEKPDGSTITNPFGGPETSQVFPTEAKVAPKLEEPKKERQSPTEFVSQELEKLQPVKEMPTTEIGKGRESGIIAVKTIPESLSVVKDVSAAKTNLDIISLYDKIDKGELTDPTKIQADDFVASRARMYMNGAQVGSDLTGFAAWTGALLSTLTALGALNTSGTQPFGANIARAALWGTELSALEIAALYNAAVSTKSLFVVGDSKSAWNYGTSTGQSWRYLARQRLYDEGKYYIDNAPESFAIAGYTVAQMRTYVDANLAAATGTPTDILINLGANDAAGIEVTITKAAWKADYAAMINAFRDKWGGVPIRVTLPWRQGYDSQCNKMATWLGEVIATYPSGVYVGDDEQVWLKGSDNGATMTTDGTHYSAAGQTEKAAQIAAFL